MEQNIQPNRPAVRPRTSSTQSKTAGEKSHSRRKIDLTGQRYGKLMVIEPSENVGGRTAWLCRCDCGRELIAKTVHLRSGRLTDCGCVPAGGSPTAIGTRLNYIDGTCVEMIRANTVRRNNTSGVPGVDWLSTRRRWRASICFKGKRYYLGRYERFEDAVKARKLAEAQMIEPFLREFAGAQNQGANG